MCPICFKVNLRVNIAWAHQRLSMNSIRRRRLAAGLQVWTHHNWRRACSIVCAPRRDTDTILSIRDCHGLVLAASRPAAAACSDTPALPIASLTLCTSRSDSIRAQASCPSVDRHPESNTNRAALDCRQLDERLFLLRHEVHRSGSAS
jgi:hypothetical protein